MIKIKIKNLVSITEQSEARKVFDKTWTMESGTEITPNLLKAMVHGGSYLSGAFIDKNQDKHHGRNGIPKTRKNLKERQKFN